MWSFGLLTASRQNRNPRTGIFVRDDRRDKRALRCSKLRPRSSFQVRKRQLPFTPVSRFFIYLFYIFRYIIKSRSLHLPWVPSLPLSLACILTFLSLLLRSRSPIVLIASLCPPLFVLWNVLHVSNCSRAFRALNCFHFHSVPSLPPFISSLRSSLEYPLVEKTKRR